MMVKVPGASLYHTVTGTGPVLLVLQGGAGDADGSAGLVKQLRDRYTVVTYDRRGLSRSPVDDPAAKTTITQHADDALAVLRSVTKEPAFAVGISLGALIGLELLSRHPESLRVLVAHEAPAAEVLPDDEQKRAHALQDAVEALHEKEGLMAAMRQFFVINRIDLHDHEGDVELPSPNPAHRKNLEFFLSHDAPAARTHPLDFEALNTSLAKLVPAIGATSQDAFPHRCAQALAQKLALSCVVFPGGHNGYVMHPKGFAAKLDEVLRNR